MKLKTAKRWYTFAVGRLTRDIEDRLCVRTLDGKLYLVSDQDEQDYLKDLVGYIVTFWIKKSNGEISRVGATGLNERLTETTVNWIWDQNFGEELNNKN